MVISGDVPFLHSVNDTEKPIYRCSITEELENLTINDCELLLDSGNTACDLLLTYHDAMKFKLKASKFVKSANTVNGELHIIRMIPSLLVAFALTNSNGLVTTKESNLDAYVKLSEVPISALPKSFRDALDASDIATKGFPGTPAKISHFESTESSLPETIVSSSAAAVPVNRPSPIKHKTHGSANLGRSGAKKLKLNYSFEKNEISFIEEAEWEFPEL